MDAPVKKEEGKTQTELERTRYRQEHQIQRVKRDLMARTETNGNWKSSVHPVPHCDRLSL